MFRPFALSALLGMTLFWAKAQQITLPNTSFDLDTPGHSKTPRGWMSCGWSTESPPDILPDGTFQVTMPAFDGVTYLGLVTRDNGTWEAVGTRLSSPIEQDKCYSMKLALAQSDSYYSVSRLTNTPANFISPVRLILWGANGNCGHGEVLAATDVINHFQWKTYTIQFRPQADSYTHLVLEVYYPENALQPTNGNLLVDGISSIDLIEDCEALRQQLEAANTRRFEKATFQLEQVDEKSLKRQGRYLKRHLRETLASIQFYIRRNDTELVDQVFQLEDESEVRAGSPQLYLIQQAMTYYPDERWVVVVNDPNWQVEAAKVSALREAIPEGSTADLEIEAYNDELHRLTDWLVAVPESGLYLRTMKK